MNPEPNSPPVARVLDRDLDPNLGPNLGPNLDPNLDPNHDLNLDLNPDLNPDRDRVRCGARARARALVLAPLLALASACQGGATSSDTGTDTSGTETSEASTPAEPMQLVRADAWVAVEEPADPLASHRPEPVDCGLGGLFVEGEELEIDTNFCNYGMLEQPGLAKIPAGATLTLAMRHFDLTAPEPATAHVALLLGDVIAWERTLIIPGPAEVITVDFEAPMAFPKGGPIRFHLHNHGQNTWILTGVTVTP